MLNNTKKNQGQAMQILFSIILLLSLMISGLLTIVFGADVYEKINGAISVEEQGDISVLKITEKYDDAVYYTKIYVKDGKLKELFASEDSAVALEDGLDIMALEGMQFKMEKEDLLSVKLTGESAKKNERVDEVFLHLRSE